MWEDGFDPLADERFLPALAAALDAHRQFGEVRRAAFRRTARLRPVVAALRKRLAVGSG